MDLHEIGSKNLRRHLDDYSLTLQHSIRQNWQALFIERHEATLGDPKDPITLSLVEYFDYCLDSDSEFVNWLFPLCAVQLSAENCSPIHRQMIAQLRAELSQVAFSAEQTQTN